MKDKDAGRLEPAKQEAVQPVPQEEEHIPPLGQTPKMADMLRFLNSVRRLPPIRFEKVHQMRELIAMGQLDTPERIDGTVRRLLEDLGR